MTLDHLYLRYFDTEIVVDSVDAAINFLMSIPEIDVTDELKDDLYQYFESRMPYPKRYKVRQRCYFIVIKTNATSLEEFKNNAATVKTQQEEAKKIRKSMAPDYNAPQPGWYDATISFKRVVPHPVSGKCTYFDTDFRVRLKAVSIQDCYDRVVDHLRSRHDIDSRSQFPSIKGKNFTFQYLGLH